jgi:hypothetical protein
VPPVPGRLPSLDFSVAAARLLGYGDGPQPRSARTTAIRAAGTTCRAKMSVRLILCGALQPLSVSSAAPEPRSGGAWDPATHVFAE